MKRIKQKRLARLGVLLLALCLWLSLSGCDAAAFVMELYAPESVSSGTTSSKAASGSTPSVPNGGVPIPSSALPQEKTVSGEYTVLNAAPLEELGAYGYRPQRWDYQALPEECKLLYDALEEAVTQVHMSANSNGLYPLAPAVAKGTHISGGNVRQTVMAFRNDNPQYFWLDNSYNYSYRLEGTRLELFSRIDGQSCQRRIEEMNGVLTKLISSVPASLPEQDREEAIFNELTDLCAYDYNAQGNDSRWAAYTSLGALTEGKAVCEGYSRAMQLLCSYLGLDCRLVNGKLDGSGHMWNLLRIDADWYHMDVTSCDSGEFPSYGYYNLTDKAIQDTHIVSPSVSGFTEENLTIADATGRLAVDFNFPLPSCTANTANYFFAKGIRIDSFSSKDDKAVVSALTAAANKGKISVALYISNNMNFDTAVSQMFQTTPYKLMEYLRQVNQRTNNQINYDKISYIADKDLRGVTLRLGYQN